MIYLRADEDIAYLASVSLTLSLIDCSTAPPNRSYEVFGIRIWPAL